MYDLSQEHLRQATDLLPIAYAVMSQVRRDGYRYPYPAEIEESTLQAVEKWLAEADDLIARMSHALEN